MAKSEAGSVHGDEERIESDEACVLRQSPRKTGPKLPSFDESKDDIDSYLRHFERYSLLQRWPKSDWAFYLGALLKGRSLDCYSRLAEPDATDYDKLKATLLRRFDLTAEGFRKKFYQAKRDQDETAAQYVVRLTAYLDRWIQLAEVEQSYEGLKSLLVRERFLDSCDDKLALYLRERFVKSLDEVVTLADHYVDAHVTRTVGKEILLTVRRNSGNKVTATVVVVRKTAQQKFEPKLSRKTTNAEANNRTRKSEYATIVDYQDTSGGTASSERWETEETVTMSLQQLVNWSAMETLPVSR